MEEETADDLIHYLITKPVRKKMDGDEFDSVADPVALMKCDVVSCLGTVMLAKYAFHAFGDELRIAPTIKKVSPRTSDIKRTVEQFAHLHEAIAGQAKVNNQTQVP